MDESETQDHATLPAVSAEVRLWLTRDLLKSVSRTFYLTLRVLPKDLREPIWLAYLLARAADTIADTTLLPPEERLNHLLSFREQVEDPDAPSGSASAIAEIAEQAHDLQARELLSAMPQAFSVLESLPDADREDVRMVVVTLTQGMEMDLTTFPSDPDSASGEQVVALKDAGELDRYTYLVAGCVGEFWTSMVTRHAPGLAGWDTEKMSAVGVRFGKALQLTNVLRDLPRDLRAGRCYLPEDELAQVGVKPGDLRDPATGPAARPVLQAWTRTALDHYRAAEDYLFATPRRHRRLRLATLWPILIGLATLGKLARDDEWLDPSHRVKVSRWWVYRMVAVSVLLVGSNNPVRAWISRLRRRVESGL